MSTASTHHPQARGSSHAPWSTWGAALVALLWVQGIAGCGVNGPGEPPRPESGAAQPHSGHHSLPLQVTNGLTVNGLTVNGLTGTGLASNGLTSNGLTVNGLFPSWFSTNPALHDKVMKYLVQCALASGQVLTYTDRITGATYTWQGLLGLAPGWGNGQPATEAEQQVVSACLAAHTNKYGLSIAISVLGAGATGQSIPCTSAELSTFSVKEAGFFGNLFSGEGIYVCNGPDTLSPSKSTARACGIVIKGQTVLDACPPLVHLGDCSLLCSLDSTKLQYALCTVNNKTYLPITTRMQLSDIYTCGDGICQFTESCGSEKVYYNCRDCGPCP